MGDFLSSLARFELPRKLSEVGFQKEVPWATLELELSLSWMNDSHRKGQDPVMQKILCSVQWKVLSWTPGDPLPTWTDSFDLEWTIVWLRRRQLPMFLNPGGGGGALWPLIWILVSSGSSHLRRGPLLLASVGSTICFLVVFGSVLIVLGWASLTCGRLSHFVNDPTCISLHGAHLSERNSRDPKVGNKQVPSQDNI